MIGLHYMRKDRTHVKCINPLDVFHYDEKYYFANGAELIMGDF